jgi:DNA-binding response OmpR family regulator
MNETELILVVEDEPAIADAVASRLRSEGFAVEVAADGPSAVERCAALAPDLVVLDLNLPGFDGLEVCRRLHRHRRVPVVMLTARDAEADLLTGLAEGADDYLTKPFSPRELVARIRAVLRRVPGHRGGGDRLLIETESGEIVIDPNTRQVTDAGRPIHLTPTEFDLLRALCEGRGAVCSRDQLLATVWGYRDGSGARTVDSHVRSLRAKLAPGLIRTVHGVGYALGPEPDPTPPPPGPEA